MMCFFFHEKHILQCLVHIINLLYLQQGMIGEKGSEGTPGNDGARVSPKSKLFSA